MSNLIPGGFLDFSTWPSTDGSTATTVADTSIAQVAIASLSVVVSSDLLPYCFSVKIPKGGTNYPTVDLRSGDLAVKQAVVVDIVNGTIVARASIGGYTAPDGAGIADLGPDWLVWITTHNNNSPTMVPVFGPTFNGTGANLPDVASEGVTSVKEPYLEQALTPSRLVAPSAFFALL